MDISNPRNRTLIAWIAMLIIGVLWGATIPLIKISASAGHSPLGLVVWQLFVGILVLGAFLLFQGWRSKLNREKLIFYLLISIFGTLLPNGFGYVAAAELPAGVMAIAIATVPMFTLIMALGIGLEKFSSKRVLGVMIGFAAMLLIAVPQFGLPDSTKAIFVLVALIAPFCYGIETNLIAAKTPKDTDPTSTLFLAYVLGFIIAAPLATMTDQWVDITIKWDWAIYALVASSVIHAITYVGYIWLVGFGGPVFGVQVAYPVTLFGIFFSIVFLDEGYSVWIWGALALVIFGLMLVQPKLSELEENTEA